MPNQNGSVYGLTILSPIIDDPSATPSHDLQIREYLCQLPIGEDSPFALAPSTHLARLVVMDDVIYVGMPSCEEHLKSKYLIFESNFDCGLGGNLDTYLANLATHAGTHMDGVWSHCVGYPGASNVSAFVTYMKRCQVETTFYFAAVNNRSVDQSLKALQTQRAVSDFVVTHQGRDPAHLQRDFLAFAEKLNSKPAPKPASTSTHRTIKTGGRNE